MEKQIYIYFMGGLGNQMFQYAFLKEWEKRGANVAPDFSFYKYFSKKEKFCLNEVFPRIKFNKVNKISYYGALTKMYAGKVLKNILGKKNMSFEEETYFKYDDRIFAKKSGVLWGFWQTEKYFSHVKEEIKADFQFVIDNPELEAIARQIVETPSSVSVHIRRGDYLAQSGIYGNICTDEYYFKAIKYMEEHFPDSVFYIFSNDIEWVKEHYKGEKYTIINTKEIKNSEDWYDMYLMSLCKNNIIANSTFSWWAAWLNNSAEKVVIAPDKWVNDVEAVDIWCDGWIRM